MAVTASAPSNLDAVMAAEHGLAGLDEAQKDALLAEAITRLKAVQSRADHLEAQLAQARTVARELLTLVTG